jgi:6-phosphogluconolactonase/glucosamine-6-phosphate isomerase/deaminase
MQIQHSVQHSTAISTVVRGQHKAGAVPEVVHHDADAQHTGWSST